MIRDLEHKDLLQLEDIHRASGLDYKFPNLADPLFITAKCVEEDSRVVMGMAAKLEATVYLWLDHAWSDPETRWEKLKELVEETKLSAWRKGLDTLTCVVPPEVADSFEKRLKAIGMERDRPWPKFSFDLVEYVPRVESEVEAT